MDDSAAHLDWTLLHAFVAVADTGSLSEAGRRIGSSQPTVSRHIRQLEGQLETQLFQRHAKGLALTEAGQGLMPHARRMEEASRAFNLAAAGQSDKLSGSVRITASVFAAHHVLPPIIAGLRASDPAIQIDLVANDQSENLLFREADIAVRMYRSTQLDIITQFIGELELGIFARRDYLDRVGRPRDIDEMFEKDVVGYDRSDRILKGFRDFGMEVERDWFATRCDHHAVYLQLIRAGCGIGFAQTRIGGADPELEQLFPDMAIPTIPVWLAAHEAMRQTPRIRKVWDVLQTELSAWVDR